jgi:hypothetical protein
MNGDEKLARQRLSVLELAEALGNVSEACRRRGMTRTQFHLKDLTPTHKSHPKGPVSLRIVGSCPSRT